MPTPPFWFRLRQGKIEAAGPDTYRLTAPNLGEAFIGIHKTENGRWLPVLKRTEDGSNLAETASDFASAQEAWDAAFESYRVQFVV
jgi:hypothetical protein